MSYWVNQVVGYTTKAEQGLETITTHKRKKNNLSQEFKQSMSYLNKTL